MLKFIAVPMALLFSLSLHAATTVETWNFRDSPAASSNSTLQITSNLGNTANISAWSDLSGSVQNAEIKLDNWGTHVGGHAINHDSSASQFILLEFNQPVILESLIASWSTNTWWGHAGTSWISVAGLNDDVVLTNNNWTDIAKSTTLRSAYRNTNYQTNFYDQNHVINSYRYTNGNTVFTQNQGIAGQASSRWLIGAYNSQFNINTALGNHIGNTLKLSLLQTSFENTVTDIPTPATFALFGLGLLLLMRRRQKFVS